MDLGGEVVTPLLPPKLVTSLGFGFAPSLPSSLSLPSLSGGGPFFLFFLFWTFFHQKIGWFEFGGRAATSPNPNPSAASSLRRTAQNFAFFSLSRHNFHSFFPLLGVFSMNFGGVF